MKLNSFNFSTLPSDSILTADYLAQHHDHHHFNFNQTKDQTN